MGITLQTVPPKYNRTPPDHGYLAWTYDPALAPGNATGSGAGALHLTRLTLPVTSLVSNIVMVIGQAGTSLTSGRNFAALYSSAGARLDLTADQTTPWASTGVKTMALAGGAAVRAAGDYYVGWYFNGTGTSVGFMRLPAGTDVLANAGLTAPNLRSCFADTGLTTSPPANFGSQTAINEVFWAALS